MKAQTQDWRRTFRLPSLMLLAAVVLSPAIANAQSSTTARTPGTPAGSYKLGDADSINLFTGNLNYELPLLGVGGRGEVQSGVGIVIEGQWDMRETELPYPQGYYEHSYTFRYPDPLALVGSVKLDVSFINTDVSCGNQGDHFVTYRVAMIYVEPNGTEHALRDRVLHGMPVDTCGAQSVNLQRTFESTSGNFVRFVTDTDIYTSCYGVSGCTDSVDGYLYFRNGTKARVSSGNIVWFQDRNGNRLNYQYETNPNDLNAKRLIKITDSLGREVNISYDVNEPEPYGRCARITYKGFGGEDKTIRISREGDLANLLRATQPQDSIRSPIEYDDPNDSIVLTGAGSMPDFVKAVWLPDGRSYRFKYNILGQLARVELPTGGAVEYDFADILQIPFDPVPGVLGPTTNKVSEKRVYDTNGALMSRTKFSNPTSYTSGVINPARGGVVRDVELFDPSGNRLAKSRHYFHGVPNTDYSLLVPWWHGKELRTETFDSDGTTLLRVSESDWRQRVPSWCSTVWPCLSNPAEVAPTNNPFVIEARTILVDGNLVSKVSAVNPVTLEWAFDAYNNQTASWAYDYGVGQPGSLLKHIQTSYINYENVGGIFLFGLPNTTSVYAVDAYGQETLASSSQIVYDEYGQYPLLSYGTVTGWQDPGSIRGNPTSVRRWLNTNDTWIETHAQFDQLGNARKSWDALGRMSETVFTDAFTDNINRNTYAFPTQSSSTIPDSTNVHGSNTPFVSSTIYDYSSGFVKTATDINGQTTTLEYNDTLNRLTKVINPTGGGWTSFEYGDSVGNLYVKTITAFDETRNVESYGFFDGLGRAVRSFAPKAGGVWIIADTQYDAAGRVHRVSKPYQDSSLSAAVNPANNWVTTQYDSLGRVIKVTTADGSESLTAYNGNTVTVTDADLKKRKTVSDALGRLTQVIEDPGAANLVTNYKYDILGNLRRGEQGQQRRYYMYDSLSRLIRSRNPEQETNPDLYLNDPLAENDQWTTSVDYLANGDVSARTDARGIRIEYLYDDLNRPYRRTYTATRTLPTGTYTPTAAVDSYYDGRGLTSIPGNSLGKLTRVSSSVSEMRYTSFDAMGRLKSSEQITDGQTYQMPSYTHNLAGALISQTYPSGRVVQNSFDNAGSLSTVTGQAPNQAAKTYASNFDYTLTNTGATSRVKLGNERWESVVYNKRLQPTLMGLGTTQNGTEVMRLEYGYGTTNNNGNMRTQTITTPAAGGSSGFTALQTYGYDNLNRLTSAIETAGGQTNWQQTFFYDDFGNRSVVTNATTAALTGDNPVISTATNRITPQATEQYQYDANGNLIKDRVGNTYSFDGENTQSAFTNIGEGQVAAEYFYDGEGRRVKKVVGNETTVFVYNAIGQLVAEYASNPQPVTNPTTYMTTDKLGTPRVNTDASGSVVARHDYLPYGEEIDAYGGRANHAEYVADSVRQKYTGLERDPENGLDYAHARYYASRAGRFTSVDPLMASASTTSPQTFNRYTYALNNPYKYVDPSGMDPELDDDTDAAFERLRELHDWADDDRQAQEDAASQSTSSSHESGHAFGSSGADSSTDSVGSVNVTDAALGTGATGEPQSSSFTNITLVYYIANKRLVIVRDVLGKGQRMPVIDGQFIIENVTSGLEGCMNDPGCTQERDKGPIPLGVFEINTSEISEASMARATARLVTGYGDWGSFRVPLHPTSDTETFGRTGFMLHGGTRSGSKGCIDVGGGLGGDNTTARLLRWMRSDTDGRIRLAVIKSDQ